MQNFGSDIDLNVLNELPEDLRKEIIKDYQLEEKIFANIKKESPNDDLNKSFIKEAVNEKHNKRNKSPFKNLPWEQIKPIIEDWTNHETKPLNVDVMMLAEHFKELAIHRKIELLQKMFNYLHRLIFNFNLNSLINFKFQDFL